MTSSPVLRKIAVFLLLCTLIGAPCAVAAGPRAVPATRAAGLGGLVAQAWSVLTALWAADGCSVDPSGRCAGPTVSPAPPTDGLDGGCSVDPNGRCPGGG